MNERELHVVLGTGQVGSALVAALAHTGRSVRAVSQHEPSHLPAEVDWRAADLTDPEAATDAAKGATTGVWPATF